MLSFIKPTKICSNDELLKAELSKISLLYHPCNIVTDNSTIEPTTIKIWIHLPFLDKYGTKLTNSFIREISPLLKSLCKFIVDWKASDANCFISLKDHTPKMYKISVVYEFKYPGCNVNYIGKTNCCLYTQVKEHSCYYSSEIYNNICSCNEFNIIKNMLELSLTMKIVISNAY